MIGTTFTIAEATPGDADAIYAMVAELAEAEGTRADLQCDALAFHTGLAGPRPRLHALLASTERHGSIGVVTFTIDYAVWTGGEVLRVDDVFVREAFRRQGVGRGLMRAIAAIALHRNIPCRWEIEVANTKAQEFYRALGVEIRDKMIARWRLSAMKA